MKNIFKKTLSIIIASVMVMALFPEGVAMAADYTVTNGVTTEISVPGDYTITSDPATTGKILIKDTYSGTLTLQGVDIACGGHPIEVEAGANVTFVLDGANALTSTTTGATYASAIKINPGAEVIIKDGTSGSLTANGGGVGAGINVMIGSSLTIESGIIVANGTGAGATSGGIPSGAGIGGAKLTGGYGNITIKDGHVTANGGSGHSGAGGAGIGNSGIGWRLAPDSDLNCGDIVIDGGTVIATGGTAGVVNNGQITNGDGAGIGQGGINHINYNTPTITNTTITGKIIINDGTVIAKGGGDTTSDGLQHRCAAGIGGGGSNEAQELLLPDIIITGGTVTATAGVGLSSSPGAAGIGTGSAINATINNIIITGGTVKAAGSYDGAGIGTGRSGGTIRTLNAPAVDNYDVGMVKNILLLGGDITACGGETVTGGRNPAAIGLGSMNSQVGNTSINIVIGAEVKIVKRTHTRDIGSRKPEGAGANGTIDSIILLPGADISYVDAGGNPVVGTPTFSAATEFFSLAEVSSANLGLQDAATTGLSTNDLTVKTDTGTAIASADFSSYAKIGEIDAILTANGLKSLSERGIGAVDEMGIDYELITNITPTGDVTFSGAGYISAIKSAAEMTSTPITAELVKDVASGEKAVVVFNYGGGEDTSGDSYSVVQGDEGDALAVPPAADISKVGYTRSTANDGWDVTPAAVFGTAGSMTIYTAQWTPEPQKVSFAASAGGTIDNPTTPGDPTDITADFGEPVGAITSAVEATPNAGYYFVGWNDDADTGIYSDAQVAAYIVNNFAALPAASVTFTAKFARTDKATAIFNYDGGLVGTAGYAVMADYPGETLTPPANPTKTGCDFVGWSTAPTAKFGAAGSSTTYTAMWSIKQYAVTFAAGANGSIAPAAHSETPNFGANVATVPTVTPATGYVFLGWDINGTGKLYSNDAVAAYIVPDAATTFTAAYAASADATVIFDYNGGAVGAASSSYVSGQPGTTYAVPTPIRTGYTFVWDTNPPPTTYGAAGSVVTYTAVWTAIPQTVTFNQGTNGALTPDPTTATVDYDAAITTVPTPVVDTGYVFAGWKLDGTSDIYSADAVELYMVKTVLPATTSFTAQYSALDAVVNFDYAGGMLAGKSASSVSGAAGGSYVTPAPTKTGYTRTWSATTPSGTFGAAGSVEDYTAVWTAIPYTVTFATDTNGDLTGTPTATVDYDAAVGAIPATVTPKTGYRFVGWSDGTRVYDAAAVQAYTVKGAVTFTAIHERTDKATVIFNYGGGLVGTAGYSVVSDYPGETLNAPSGIVKTGYTRDTTNEWDAAPTATFGAAGSTTTYTAQWTVDAQVVRFDQGTNGTLAANPTDVSVNYGDVVTAGNVPAVTTDSVNGWKFIGWSDGTGIYDDDAVAAYVVNTVTNPAVIFTAEYARTDKATVMFDFDGGTVGTIPYIILSDYPGEPILIPPIMPDRPGHTMVSWDAAPTLFGAAGSFTKYTAIWTVNLYTVTFNQGVHGTLAANPTTAAVDYDVAITAANTPLITADTGYVFTGWSDGTGLYNDAAVAAYIVKGDVTFTAQYTDAAEATVIFNYNGGTVGADISSFISGKPGTDYTAAVPVPSRAGYTFDAWVSSDPSDTFKTYGDPSSIVMYTATWTPLPYTVTFLAGTNGTMTPNTATETVFCDASVTSVPAIATYTYWKFLGWSMNGSSTYYKDAEVLLMPITGDTTFEAQYQELVINNITIGGGYATSSNKKNNTPSPTPTQTPTPTVSPLPTAEPEPTPVPTPDGSWKNPFADVKADDWFYDAMKYVNENELMDGTSGSSFEPNINITRGMLITMLFRAEDEPSTTNANPFGDVYSEQWYADAVVWGAENQIISGYGDGIFAPADNITREQFALILYNYAKFKGVDVSASADLSTFADDSEVSGWANTAMQWAVASGLIQGREANTLVPGGYATRAEAATLMMRFMEQILK